MKSIQQDHQDACYLADELGVDTKGLPSLFNEYHILERYAHKLGIGYSPGVTLDDLQAKAQSISSRQHTQGED